jgi:hypothetical protein
MIHQLRIYEIFESNKAAFHARFREHAAPIMKRYGFDIIAMWETRRDAKGDRPAITEFVYLLAWPDEAAKTAAWDAFLRDPEWVEIKRRTAAEHGTLVGGIEDRTLHFVPYSPRSDADLAA